MSGTLLLGGLGLAALGVAVRMALRHGRPATEALKRRLDLLPGAALSKYYHGGFESNMSRREAALILGISQTANRTRIREAHKRIMLLNHPDLGGSPYLAAKINEAKAMLEKTNLK